jgi:KRAB domain-containing zinc finger protein
VGPGVCIKYTKRSENGSQKFTIENKEIACESGVDNNRFAISSEKNLLLECKVCCIRFKTEGKLKQHSVIHSTENPFVCDICGKRFQQFYYFDVHLQAHISAKPYMCQLCGKRFLKQRSLKIHYRSHTVEKPYVCDCEKWFTEPCPLRKHAIMHTEDIAHVCGICGKAFAHSGQLKKHSVSHKRKQPFVCVVCNKEFLLSSQLKLHYHIHTGEKTHMWDMRQGILTI